MNIMRKTEAMYEDALRNELRTSLNDLLNRCLILTGLLQIAFISLVLIWLTS